jgi:hypothetical protein
MNRCHDQSKEPRWRDGDFSTVSEMNSSCFLQLIMTVILITGFSPEASAEDPADAVSKRETQKRDKAKKEQKQERKKERKQERKKAKTGFIDRNGDGIQDGQEHRFRGKHRRRLKWDTHWQKHGHGCKERRPRCKKGSHGWP